MVDSTRGRTRTCDLGIRSPSLYPAELRGRGDLSMALEPRLGGPRTTLFPPMAPALFLFGAMSPYSWFAAERIGTLIPDAQWRPVFAGGLFQATGRSSWGLSDRRDAGIADCQVRAQLHGLGPIRWPDGWPSSDVLVARALVVADERGRLAPFALAAMRAQFRAGERLDDPHVLERVADEVGLGGANVIEATSAPAIKTSLRARHDQAVALGVSGVPTVVVGDRLFWGDDRLDEAAEEARAVR
jgi:2-hydroxychromene-2-carboxylate isomerase